MSKSVLHFANYQANYTGNFIEALRLLSLTLKKQAINTVYVFPTVSSDSAPGMWMAKMKQHGDCIYNFTNNVLSDCKMLRKIIKLHDIGIIHVHFFNLKHMIAIKMATIGLDVKLVMHFHNHSKPANFMKMVMRQQLYRNATMIANAKSVLNSIERDYPKNESYKVDNCIELARLDRFVEIDRSEYSLQENTIILMMFGFDYYRKGVDKVINALKVLNKEKTEFELLLVLSSNMEKNKGIIIDTYGEIPNYVKIVPTRTDVASLYHFCDVFMSPSREEGQTYSVTEAAYCGCKVIASDIDAQKELSGIPYIIYHKAEDINDLIRAINQAIIQKNDSDAVKKYIYDKFNLSRWVSEVICIYRGDAKSE